MATGSSSSSEPRARPARDRAALAGALAISFALGAAARLGQWTPERLGGLANATLTFASIAVGFLVTTKSILLASEHLSAVEMMTKNDRFSDLAELLSRATRSSFALVVMSIVCMSLPAPAVWWAFPFWTLATGASGATLVQGSEKLSRIFVVSARSREEKARAARARSVARGEVEEFERHTQGGREPEQRETTHRE